MGEMYKLMIGNFFCETYHWNTGIVKQLWKPSKNKSQCWQESLSVFNKFWYEDKLGKNRQEFEEIIKIF